MWNLKSDLKALKEIQYSSFFSTIWGLAFLKRIEKIIWKRLSKRKGIKKPGWKKCNPGLLAFEQLGPCFVRQTQSLFIEELVEVVANSDVREHVLSTNAFIEFDQSFRKFYYGKFGDRPRLLVNLPVLTPWVLMDNTLYCFVEIVSFFLSACHSFKSIQIFPLR